MYKSSRLFDEFIDIARDNNTGKIDHSPNGHKDALDAVCGATFTASKYAEQYAFDYGEDLNTVVQVSSQGSISQQQQSISDEFQAELARMFDPMATRKQPQQKQTQPAQDIKNKPNVLSFEPMKNTQPEQSGEEQKSPYLDFGLGPAKPVPGAQYLSQGIVVW